MVLSRIPCLIFVALLVLRFSTATRYVWMGAVTSNSFTIHMDIQDSENEVFLTSDSSLKRIIQRKAVTNKDLVPGDAKIYGRLHKFTFDTLRPKTRYYIGVRDSREKAKQSNVSTIDTFPTAGDKSTDVVFGMGSCQLRAIDSQSLREISVWNEVYKPASKSAPSNAFFMLHMGDLHYSNIETNSPRRFESATRRVVEDSGAQYLFRSVPVVYMPDDHDFGGNNADSTSKSKPAVHSNYRAMVPAYKPAVAGNLYHAFTVGSVRFIITDLRSNARAEKDSTMGKAQRDWFLRELASAKKFSVVVWMSSKPWIARSRPGKDDWGGFPQERRQIANEIATLKINNLIVVSGDAHMLAADNGKHSDYADRNKGPSGFPVLHAAPLGNFGSSKGGPYTEGCQAYRFMLNYQYAIVRISPTAKGGPCIEYKGYKVIDARDTNDLKEIKPIITFKKCAPIGGVDGIEGGGQGSCPIPLAPWWFWFCLVVGLFFTILLIAICCVRCRLRSRKFKVMQSQEAEPIDPDRGE